MLPDIPALAKRSLPWPSGPAFWSSENAGPLQCLHGTARRAVSCGRDSAFLLGRAARRGAVRLSSAPRCSRAPAPRLTLRGKGTGTGRGRGGRGTTARARGSMGPAWGKQTRLAEAAFAVCDPAPGDWWPGQRQWQWQTGSGRLGLAAVQAWPGLQADKARPHQAPAGPGRAGAALRLKGRRTTDD